MGKSEKKCRGLKKVAILRVDKKKCIDNNRTKRKRQMMEAGKNPWGKMKRKKTSKIAKINQRNKTPRGSSNLGENLIPYIDIIMD
jgi:hypothetical protein